MGEDTMDTDKIMEEELHNMEIAELQSVNNGDPSYFAEHWRETVIVPSHIYSRRNKK